MRQIINIEKFFLLTLLRISIAGVSLILITDALVYPQDMLSVDIDAVILSACLFSYFIRNKYFTLSALIITVTTLVAMFYQCLVVPINTTTSFSILLIVGFTFSILLKGKLQWTMHGITVCGIVVIFIIQSMNPSMTLYRAHNEVITLAITYIVLYFIVSYCTSILKSSYDNAHQDLHDANIELQDKANEIETQNEELRQIQDNLNALNADLERIVNERTNKIKTQNEVLIKYSYANAHHLRGPIARLLGLVAICRLDKAPNYEFYLEKIEGQTMEIDTVVRQINSELATS